MNLIPEHKAQLISLPQKQPTINVIDITGGRPATIAEKIRSLKDQTVTAITIKSRIII